MSGAGRFVFKCVLSGDVFSNRMPLTTVESAKHLTTKTIRNDMMRASVRWRCTVSDIRRNGLGRQGNSLATTAPQKRTISPIKNAIAA